MPVKKCVWLNNEKGLIPELGKTREQNEAETLMLGEQRSFHLSTEDNELLTQEGILPNQIGTVAS